MGNVVKSIPFHNVVKSPARGDVFYADLSGIEKSIGSEQTGRRPVIIIQNNVGNMHATTTVVAIITTNIKRRFPTHVGYRCGLKNLSNELRNRVFSDKIAVGKSRKKEGHDYAAPNLRLLKYEGKATLHCESLVLLKRVK